MNLKMKYFVVLVSVLFLISCKKQDSEPDRKVDTYEKTLTDKESEEIIDEMYNETPNPPKEPATKQGEVTFGTDTFEVIEEESDNISIISQFTNGDYGPEMTSAKYREKVFYLTNKKTGDKVTIDKSLFKDYSNKGDFPQLLLQSVAFDVKVKSGNVPLLVSLCKPDTDICDDYSITLKNSKVKIERVDLGEMGE